VVTHEPVPRCLPACLLACLLTLAASCLSQPEEGAPVAAQGLSEARGHHSHGHAEHTSASHGSTEAEEESATEREHVTVNGRVTGAPQIGGSGQLESTYLNAELRSISSRIQRCYERSLVVDPHRMGQLSLEFTIDRTGSVGHVALVMNMLGASMGECAVRAVERSHFDAPRGGSVEVLLPFAFFPSTLPTVDPSPRSLRDLVDVMSPQGQR
jgi:hypothetical protein